MESILSFLRSVDTSRLASDPRVLVAAGFLFVLAVVFRWKSILLILFAIAGTMAVMHVSHAGDVRGGVGLGLVVFVGGSILVGVVLIYFLFIRGD